MNFITFHYIHTGGERWMRIRFYGGDRETTVRSKEVRYIDGSIHRYSV